MWPEARGEGVPGRGCAGDREARRRAWPRAGAPVRVIDDCEFVLQAFLLVLLIYL